MDHIHSSLGWIDRLRLRWHLRRDARLRAVDLAPRVGLLDTGELVIVDADGRAQVIDDATVRLIDDTLWARALAQEHAAGAVAAEGRSAVVARGSGGGSAKH